MEFRLLQGVSLPGPHLEKPLPLGCRQLPGSSPWKEPLCLAMENH